MRIVSRGMAITLAALSLAGSALAAPVETVLYRFKDIPDGRAPFADLIADKQGALYGTTLGGGTFFGVDGAGTVFKLTPPAKGQTAWTETVLHRFCSLPNCSDGAFTRVGLIADEQGALYGTTEGGGTSDQGTVFKLTPPAKGQTAWTETVLYSFCSLPNCSDGAFSLAGLIADKQGALYGTTETGGTGSGTVFKLTPPAKGQTAWTETVLYRFKGGSDGFFPVAGLIAGEEGALYGTTGGGSGTRLGFGTVFKLTPPAKGQTAWTETVLHRFCSLPNCSDGAFPQAGLIADEQGALYGTTSGDVSGPFGSGTVFKLTPRAEDPAKGQTAWTETVLYRFCSLPNCSDGGAPFAGLIADEQGALYGTTSGDVSGPFGSGTVFKLTPPAKGQTAWTETVLYRFKGGSDGFFPFAGLIADKQGALYSTTGGSGTGNGGMVFKLTLCEEDKDHDHDGCPAFRSEE